MDPYEPDPYLAQMRAAQGKGQPMSDDELFERGIEKRKEVLGAKYVEANLAGSDDFMMTFQRAVTELAWGYAWSRPGLDQKTRSILTLGILAGLGRFQELGIYTNARWPAARPSMRSKKSWFILLL